MFHLSSLRRGSRLGIPEIDVKYKILGDIGKGNFAIVKKIKNRSTNVEYALKIINRRKLGTTKTMIDTELAILRKVHHCHVVCLVDAYETEENLYLVMEYCAGGELFDRIVEKGSYTETDASLILRQVAEALEYLHEQGIVHRDLKPENLLLTSKEEKLASIKITDFGLSKILPSASAALQTACGTPGYVAPEVLLRKGYNKEVDMWSLGVLMYILLCGYPPFYHEDQKTMLRQIVKGIYAFHEPYWTTISASAKDLISRLLIVDPMARLTASECLAHPWICGVDVPKLDIAKSVQPQLRRELAKRRFRSAVNAVTLIHRLRGKKNSKNQSRFDNLSPLDLGSSDSLQENQANNINGIKEKLDPLDAMVKTSIKP